MASVAIDADLSDLSSKELIRAEQAIAKQFMGGVPWLAVFWAFANLTVWLSLWPLVILGYIPLWAGFLVATVNITLSYLPSHEAQHDIIGRPGTKWHWLNEAVGHLSLIPLVLPYRVARLTHYEHHRHTHDPELDPDYESHAPTAWRAIWKTLRNRQPRSEGQLNGYGNVLVRLGRPDVVLDGIINLAVYYGILCALAWSGYGVEALLLWWLPRHIGLSYIIFFLSWAPHHTGEQKGRYRNSRAWRSKLGNIGSLGMQFHIIHHLYPNIPLTRTPAAFYALKPILKARGCDVGTL